MKARHKLGDPARRKINPAVKTIAEVPGLPFSDVLCESLPAAFIYEALAVYIDKFDVPRSVPHRLHAENDPGLKGFLI